MQNYTELMREISRLTPKLKDMFMLQDEQGKRIASDKFIPRTKIVVRSIMLKPPKHDMLHDIAYDWEKTEYHEVRLKREAVEREELETQQLTSFLE